ncbi:GntR family transcriptional regulator [bacterium]|nr:MAG: GntR family transcriptional regulator [bacterium]
MKSAKYIADRIRLLIATKQFQVDEILPSTRELGRQLDVSFHTVRKAYLALEQEGLIRGETGRGFVVTKQTSALNKEERIEKGAEKMKQMLEELVGFGLSEEEIETVFEEQLTYMEWPSRIERSASVGMNEEHARMISGAIEKAIGVKSESISWNNANALVDYDALFVPIAYLQHFQTDVEDILIIPVVYQYEAQFLIDLSSKYGISSVGLVTSKEETIPFLLDEIKSALKLQSSIIAGAIYGKSLPLFVRDVDFVIYPPYSAQLVERQMPEKKRITLEYTIADHSLNLIRAELWDQ